MVTIRRMLRMEASSRFLRNKSLAIKRAVLFLSIIVAFQFGRYIEDRSDTIYSLRSEVNFLEKRLMYRQKSVLPESTKSIIYAITPTYSRPVQLAELTRLANTFLHIENLHWIIVEDSNTTTYPVSKFLTVYSGLFTHLAIPTPDSMKLKSKDSRWSKPRGVYQRNLALKWIRDNSAHGEQGIIYFADDDNSYSIDLFPEIRDTTGVSVFPVGLVGGVLVEKPRVKNGRVVSWDVGWGADRQFAVDMAGFAVNLQFYLSQRPAVEFADKVKVGRQESAFLQKLGISLHQLEPKTPNRVLVWHTRTEQPDLKSEPVFRKKFGHSSDLGILL